MEIHQLDTLLRLGNYNTILDALETADKLLYHRYRTRLGNLFNEKSIQDVRLQPQYCNLLGDNEIPCPHKVIIPAYAKQLKQAMLVLPRFSLSAGDHGESHESHTNRFKQSFDDAYENLLPILWKTYQFIDVDKGGYAYKILLPGGQKCHDETEGRSAGLGFLVAMFMESVSDLELAKPVAFTGSLELAGVSEEKRLQSVPVHKVGYLVEKVKAVCLERPDIDKIIIPKGNEKHCKRLSDKEKQKIFLVETVEQALDICFGNEWHRATAHKGIRGGDPKKFFAKAQQTRRHHRERRARIMFLHLVDCLKDRKDAQARNIYAQSLHRIARTYDLHPNKTKDAPEEYKGQTKPPEQMGMFDYLQECQSKIEQLIQEGMLEDMLEEGKVATGFCKYYLHNFEFHKALEWHARALEKLPNLLHQMPNYALHGHILLHQQQYERAEEAFNRALGIARQALDSNSELRYRCHLLLLYTLQQKWDQALEMCIQMPQDDDPSYEHKTKGHAKVNQAEYICWAYLYGQLPEQLQEEKDKINLLGKRPDMLFYKGLIHYTQPTKAEKFLLSSQKAFENLNEFSGKAKSGNIPVWQGKMWSVLPLVGRHYMCSLKEGKNVFNADVIADIKQRMDNYRLNDQQEPFQKHLGQWQTIGDDLKKLLDWFQGFRRLIPTL